MEEEIIDADLFAQAGKLKKDLEDAKLKCEEYLNGWKRERADFLNYKKEEMERISQLVKYANEEIILKILPILDNIYLAELHVPEELKNHAWTDGFNKIKNQLRDFLQKEGIEVIKAIGQPFNPEFMESIDGEGDKVSEEVQKGYTLNGKLIRPAKVRVEK